MTTPNLIAALVSLLKADATVLALSGGRVFGGELPEAEAANMPRAAVVITPSGGLPERGVDFLTRPRIDVRSYGATQREGYALDQAVNAYLKHNLRKSATNTLVHAVSPESGPFLLRDADAKWPLTFRTYIVLAAEVAV